MDHLPLEKQERTLVFVLYSIHNVMKAEKVLRSQEVLFDTIPVPKEISADCGMAILVACDNRKRVRKMLENSGIDIKGIYLRTCGRYEKEND
ncbi:MAG: hypothetical protein DRG82_06315 [Deltaproteobacteria bacterium]|nr:MAG: hypothetical protein B1H13_01650 [Desulfobacteraceae bacterium 4484_190.3]RLB17496.1 MAG: hypothetical protein DRG82_06315 [Deltaproteobacteria bacterium]